jgi:3-oxoacyl-[acyl-carrier protein] reductase
VKRLAGRRAVITGGARGIGRGVADLFAQEGAAIGIIDVLDSTEQAAAELREAGATAFARTADVTSSSEIRKAVDELAGELSGIDAMVCVAGITRPAPAAELPEEDWRAVIEVNLTGAFLSVQASLPWLEKSDSGSVVVVGSVASEGGPVGRVNYSSSKAGLQGMVKNLAVEYGPKGVRFNIVAPGHIISTLGIRDEQSMRESAERTPLRRLGSVEDVAAACLFFASDNSSYVTGQVLNVCGGKTLWSRGVS